MDKCTCKIQYAGEKISKRKVVDLKYGATRVDIMYTGTCAECGGVREWSEAHRGPSALAAEAIIQEEAEKGARQVKARWRR